ncbi:hypothetical protein M8J77_001006 [Diaphorina citri]|nr:hypothetical protein M8J77_001006 [Diaphorina citri]
MTFRIMCLALLLVLLRSSDSSNVNRYAVVEENVEEVSPNEDPTEEIKWMLMPDGKGSVRIGVLSGLRSESEKSEIDYNDVKFMLYTRKNPKDPEVRSMTAECKPVFKHFKPSRRTKILVHGFGDNSDESLMFPLLRDAYLEKDDYNIFTVDWSPLAKVPWYNSAARNTMPVGIHTARFIDHLIDSTGADARDVHLVGFSLGAHVVGMAGKHVKSRQIRHVTGLDPAQVLFTKSGPDERLDASHAEWVDVVHTSGGYLGFSSSLGHRDFYPNGGDWPQPGCTWDYAAVCSHRRAYYYYAEAIRNHGKGFTAVSCPSYEYFEKGECKAMDNATLPMGLNNFDSPAKGSFYFETNPEEPFGVKSKKKSKSKTKKYHSTGKIE